MIILDKEPAVAQPRRPLSKYALDALQSLHQWGPKPRYLINSGANERLESESLTEVFFAPAPHRPMEKIQFVKITPAGIERLRASR